MTRVVGISEVRAVEIEEEGGGVEGDDERADERDKTSETVGRLNQGMVSNSEH